VNLYSLLVKIEHNGDESPKDVNLLLSWTWRYTGGGKWSASNTECFTPGAEPPYCTENVAGCTQDTVWTIWRGAKYLAQKV